MILILPRILIERVTKTTIPQMVKNYIQENLQAKGINNQLSQTLPMKTVKQYTICSINLLHCLKSELEDFIW